MSYSKKNADFKLFKNNKDILLIFTVISKDIFGYKILILLLKLIFI